MKPRTLSQENLITKFSFAYKKGFFAYIFDYKHVGNMLLGLVSLSIVAVLLVPTFALSTGNLFFGGIPILYNLPLAQFLFERSVTPAFFQPVPPYAHHQLSRTYFIEGDLLLAAIEAEKEIALYPNNTRTYYILGLTYGYMNRELEAIAAFSKYIETYPVSWPARNDKAWLQFRIGEIDEAIATIEPIVESYPKTVWVQNTYCVLLMNKERFVEAKSACMRAKEAVGKMTEQDWGRSYPGNDPRVYPTGLKALKLSIDSNLALINSHS